MSSFHKLRTGIYVENYALAKLECCLLTVCPDKNRQMSIKVAQ